MEGPCRRGLETSFDVVLGGDDGANADRPRCQRTVHVGAQEVCVHQRIAPAPDERRQMGQPHGAKRSGHRDVGYAFDAGLKLRPQVVVAKVDQVNVGELAQTGQQLNEMALRPANRERRDNLQNARPAPGHVRAVSRAS